MCYLIYFTLLALALYFSGDLLEQHALSVTTGNADWMIMAISWEIIPALWPVFLLTAVLGSAVTFFALRLWSGRS